MKTIALLLFTSFISLSQSLVVTPEGLRDSQNTENSFVVIDCHGHTAQELYENALKYVNENYKNPEEVIKGRTDGEYLKFDTYAGQFTTVNNSGVKLTVSMSYTTEIRFKDNRTRYEITSININADNGGNPVMFSGSIWKGFPIYNQKNGDLKQPDTKADIENYFNVNISSLTTYLHGQSNTNDDW